MSDDSGTNGFTAQERAAITQRADELRTEAARPRGGRRAAEELDVLQAIAAMSDADRAVAERLHVVVTTNAPDLAPKLWYGQPAYAREGKVVCFFRSGDVDKERYSTFGFTAEAALDHDSGVWPTSFAVAGLGEDAVERIAALVRTAAG